MFLSKARDTDTNADIAGLGLGVAFGHVGSPLNMASQNKRNRLTLTHLSIERAIVPAQPFPYGKR